MQGNYTRAIKLFEALEARFPYGRYAQQAILELAYANYRAGETAAAVAACDRFIRTFPNNQNVDYAYYLKGLVNFREDQGLLGYVYELDLAEREPKGMRESFAAFKELVAKFPESRYAQDATDRMLYLTNALAKYEVNVARYYYNRGAYIAAINRAQAAIVGYPRTAANEAALDVLVKSYDKLGLTQLRDDSLRILRADVSGQHLSRRTGRQALVEVLVSPKAQAQLRVAVLGVARRGVVPAAPAGVPRAIAARAVAAGDCASG